jgi:hypothetical protein
MQCLLIHPHPRWLRLHAACSARRSRWQPRVGGRQSPAAHALSHTPRRKATGKYARRAQDARSSPIAEAARELAALHRGPPAQRHSISGWPLSRRLPSASQDHQDQSFADGPQTLARATPCASLCAPSHPSPARFAPRAGSMGAHSHAPGMPTSQGPAFSPAFRRPRDRREPARHASESAPALPSHICSLDAQIAWRGPIPAHTMRPGGRAPYRLRFPVVLAGGSSDSSDSGMHDGLLPPAILMIGEQVRGRAGGWPTAARARAGRCPLSYASRKRAVPVCARARDAGALAATAWRSGAPGPRRRVRRCVRCVCAARLLGAPGCWR